MTFYDLPILYQDYVGYILLNGATNESSCITLTENVGGNPRVYITKDLGEFNTSFRLIDGSFVNRVIDYKVQADSRNYYYFKDSNEWVAYHTLNEESYYGNRFYPILGAVSCYDQNDEEIHPTDIMFYPECIKDGVFEGAKVIIKWASNQSGKVCFNPGFSNDESQDQSRLILPVSRYNWTQTSDKMVCTVGLDRERRATAQNIIEPFMTVDAIDNGSIVEYKFVSHVPSIVTDNNLKPFYYGNIRIRADKRFFINLDKVLNNESNVNTDILNTIIVGSNTLADIADINFGGSLPSVIGRSNLITPNGWSNIYDPFVYSTNKICLDLSSIPSTVSGYGNLETDKYISGNEMAIVNAGYVYDEDAQYKHQMKYYTCGISPSPLFLEWIFSETSIYDVTKKIDRYEIMKPLIKAPGLDGYLKIVSKSKTHPLVAVEGGKFECEYVLEFPCCPGSTTIRSGDGDNDIVNMFDNSDEYRLGQIFYPQSIVKAGGFYEEPNERTSFNIDQSFTTTVLAENGFSSTTHRRTKGGGENELGAITYPTNEIYRNVVPNRLDSLANGYEIEVLKKDDATSGRPRVDMKLFVLYRNDKWRYDRDKFESVSGRENPSYIFEIDVETMLLDFSDKFKDYPTLPDVKRWFTAYCRGFAHIASEDYTTKVPEPDSELVLEIWDIVTGNWRSITPSKNDDTVFTGNVYINEYRTFKFGGETVVSSSSKIKKYFDLKAVLAKYIDGNKIYFRARVCRSREFGIKKNTTDVDAFHDGDPWGGDPINPSAVNRDENISQFGLDYFRMESL